MKNLKENRGFTLIELLAVIVILAIVMVLASQSILPFMRNAARDSFALEANGAIDAASNAISLISIGSIKALDGSYGTQTAPDKSYQRSADGTKYCFSIEYLAKMGLFDLDTDRLYKDGTGYKGRVIATKESGKNSYEYIINMGNEDFTVMNKKNTVADEDPKVSQSKDLNDIPENCDNAFSS